MHQPRCLALARCLCYTPVMLSRTIISSLALLILAIFLLANCASPPQARATLPLTPPPLTAQAGRVGPPASQPIAPLAATSTATSATTSTTTATGSSGVSVIQPLSQTTVSMTPTLSMTPVLSVTPTVSPTPVITTGTLTDSPILISTPAAIFLPTVTPTPLPDTGLLPTPTTTPPPLLTPLVPILPTTAITAIAPLTETIAVTITTPVTAIPSRTDPLGGADAPSPFITVTIPLPASYEAQGSFASQTVYTDSTTAQQGSFTILQTATTNAYGSNQHYTLRTQRSVDELTVGEVDEPDESNELDETGEMGEIREIDEIIDEIDVYQIDDYVAVNYTGGDWMLVRRDQGSNIVRAIQPITDLALLFPRIIDQAELVGPEEVAGISTLRYRIDDPSGPGARLIQPMLALTGDIRALTLDVWIAVPGGYVMAYNFQVELAGARVLDTSRNETRADQSVTWTYQLTPNAEPQPIPWPDDAPTPNAFPVPGFTPGTFPLPPNTELLALVGGVPELTTNLTPQEVDSFYRSELYLMGWLVEGEGGLLRCSKAGASFQLLISAETTANETLITVLPID